MFKALISKKLKSRLQISLINNDPVLQNLLEHMLRTHGFMRISKYQNPAGFLLDSGKTDCVIVDQLNFMDSNRFLIEKLQKSVFGSLVIVLHNSNNLVLPEMQSSKISLYPLQVNFETGHRIHLLLKRLIKSRFRIERDKSKY
jgi:hypothetical protein